MNVAALPLVLGTIMTWGVVENSKWLLSFLTGHSHLGFGNWDKLSGPSFLTCQARMPTSANFKRKRLISTLVAMTILFLNPSMKNTVKVGTMAIRI